MNKDILVVVDMQNDFIDGTLANPAAQAIVFKIVDRILAFDGRAIVVTQDTHDKNYLNTPEGKHLPVEHCRVGSEGHMLNPYIQIALNRAYQRGIKIIYTKKSTFGFLDWENTFKGYKIDIDTEVDKFIYVGTCTGICVLSNVVITKTLFPEKTHQVVEQECACVTPESHKAAIETLKLLQAEII